MHFFQLYYILTVAVWASVVCKKYKFACSLTKWPEIFNFHLQSPVVGWMQVIKKTSTGRDKLAITTKSFVLSSRLMTQVTQGMIILCLPFSDLLWRSQLQRHDPFTLKQSFPFANQRRINRIILRTNIHTTSIQRRLGTIRNAVVF